MARSVRTEAAGSGSGAGSGIITANGGGGNSLNVSTGGSSGSGSDDVMNGTCASQNFDVQRKPAEILIVLDRSASMNDRPPVAPALPSGI